MAWIEKRELTSFGLQKLSYGDESVEISSAPEQNRHEIYRRNDGKLDFVGIFTHNLEVKETQADESLLKLRENYEMCNDQKAAATT